jgi:hypothetical protein
MLPDRAAFANVGIAKVAPRGMFMRSAFRFLTGGIEEAICVFFMRLPEARIPDSLLGSLRDCLLGDFPYGLLTAITMNSMAGGRFPI